MELSSILSYLEIFPPIVISFSLRFAPIRSITISNAFHDMVLDATHLGGPCVKALWPFHINKIFVVVFVFLALLP